MGHPVMLLNQRADLRGCAVLLSRETTWGRTAHLSGLEDVSSLLDPNSAQTTAFSPSCYWLPWHTCDLKSRGASSWKDPCSSSPPHMQHNMEVLWRRPCACIVPNEHHVRPAFRAILLTSALKRSGQIQSSCWWTIYPLQELHTLELHCQFRRFWCLHAQSGMKARSMAIVWLQQWGAKLSGLNNPFST